MGTDKKRTLTQAELDALVPDFIGDYQHNESTSKPVDPQEFADKFKITISLVKEVYILAMGRGLANVHIAAQTKPTVKHKAAYVTPKGGILLSNGTVKDLNKNLGDKDKFQQGDEFDVTLEGDKIILTRIARVAHQEMASLEESSTSENSSGEDS